MTTYTISDRVEHPCCWGALILQDGEAFCECAKVDAIALLALLNASAEASGFLRALPPAKGFRSPVHEGVSAALRRGLRGEDAQFKRPVLPLPESATGTAHVRLESWSLWVFVDSGSVSGIESARFQDGSAFDFSMLGVSEISEFLDPEEVKAFEAWIGPHPC